MPTFIKTGYWEKIQKGYKGWLNLDDLIGSSIGTGSAGQITYWNSPTSLSGGNLYWDSVNNRLTIGAGGFSGDFEINKQSAILQSYRNNNNGVNLTTGASVYQWDILGQRNGVASTLARMQVFYNGDGITRRGQILLGVAETSGFGGASFLLSQTANNDKIVNLGMNVSSYLSNDTTITTTYAQHATVVVNGHTSLPIMSWDKQGIVQNIMFNNGNLALNSTTDAGYKLDVNGTGRVQGTFVATGTSFISSISTIGTYSPFATFNVVNDGPASISCDRFSTNALPTHINLRKSRGTSAAPTIVATSDELGYIGFWGHDGTAFQRVGIIYVRAASVTGSTITPTMQFGTGTSSGANQYHITIYNSGNVAFGTNAPEESSAQVSMASITKGFLPPRMTSAQKTAIATPATGLVVYDTTLNKLCVYTGAAWQTVSSA